MPEENLAIKRMLALKHVAVVGISDDPSRPSHRIAAYLLRAGYDVIPVNPKLHEVLGLKSFPDLASVDRPVELVNVFRLPKFCPEVTRAALAAGARGVWLQSGIVSPEAAAITAETDIDFVQDRCIMIEHANRA